MKSPRSVPLSLAVSMAVPVLQKKPARSEFHLGPWEQEIGYSQSVRVGDRIIVSGTVGSSENAKDMGSQLKAAYASIIKTLAHDNATMKDVVKETIYCLDIDALIACKEIRKKIYEGNLPAGTWVQVQRLYSPEHLLEIELEAILTR